LLARLDDHEVTSARQLEALNALPEVDDTLNEPIVVAPMQAPVVLELPIDPEPEPEPEPTQPAAIETQPSALAPLPDLGRAELRTLPAMQTLTGGVTHVTGLPGEGLDIDDDIDAVDAVDADLFPIFEEEALELLPQLAGELREWLRQPGDARAGNACRRTLHTFKGGARLAGAMRLGELAHRLETSIERLLSRGDVVAEDVEPLESRVDVITAVFEALRNRDAQAYADATAAVQARPDDAAVLEAPSSPMPLMEHVDLPIVSEPEIPVPAAPAAEPVAPVTPAPIAAEVPVAPAAPVTPAAPQGDGGIDWSRFTQGAAASGVQQPTLRTTVQANQAAVRVRPQLLDRLVNQAGEVSITRARLESEVGQIKGSLTDLTDNLERLRQQLRDIELQAETQMASRMEAAKAEGQSFDPLEFDRFTRFQEITRMMAESVNDVATVQRALQRTLETTEDELAAQARLTRDLQDDLLRTRMVEFEGLSERLYRVVRLAAKETGKQVRLDIVGGAIEVDRGVLDRMTASFEHLLRNCVTHGIEPPEQRTAAGKDSVGTIVVGLHQEGNEVAIEFRDDGAGLNLRRIRERAVAMGLIRPDEQPSDADLANLIFTPGFSTAESVTELAGRGVGMDVVRSDVNAMGGRIETATAAGQGTSFKLVLPLTTAVTQIVMLRCGNVTVGVPASLIEIVRRANADEVNRAYETGVYLLGDQMLPFFWMGALLQSSGRGLEGGRTLPVMVVRSAQQRVALHVDEVLGTQEVVVKNLGPQLSRLPGLAGMTLLASGAVALIYNPVALATVYGEAARALTTAALHPAAEAARLAEAAAQERAAAEEPTTPLVLVVDDSLTVRRVTQRLLAREGYRVSLAKDGLEALERLAEERPSVVLSDIEMPRMDGFDLVRNIRADSRLADLPVIMITSRIAQKHRDYAVELGVNHYLGKPYSEEELLALIGRYVAQAAEVQPLH
jgi:chemosensory pili system protein ChpA (sensor histidine kinase/response regulator)